MSADTEKKSDSVADIGYSSDEWWALRVIEAIDDAGSSPRLRLPSARRWSMIIRRGGAPTSIGSRCMSRG